MYLPRPSSAPLRGGILPLLRLVCMAAAVSALIFTSGCQRKQDPAAATRAFFEMVGKGETAKAYESSSMNFKSLQSQTAFETTSKELGLVGEKEVQTGAPAFEPDGRTAKVDATITTASGQVGKVVVTLVEETGGWRVYAIRTPKSVDTGLSQNIFSLVGKTASFTEPSSQSVPDPKAIRRLVTDALLEFNQAIEGQSFSGFYDYVSAAWQAQLTEKQLQNAFQSFIDNKVDISEIKNLEPVIDKPPLVSTDGLLIVEGHYPTKPLTTYFSLKFVYELPRWRLFGIDVTLRQ